MGVQWRPISGSIHDLHVSAPGPYVAAGGFFKNLVCGFQKSIFHRLVRCVQKARNQSLGLLLGQFDPHLPWFRRISILRGFKNFRIFGDHAIFEVSLKWGWPPPSICWTDHPGMRNRTIALGSPIFTGGMQKCNWSKVAWSIWTDHPWYLTDFNFYFGASNFARRGDFLHKFLKEMSMILDFEKLPENAHQTPPDQFGGSNVWVWDSFGSNLPSSRLGFPLSGPEKYVDPSGDN